MTTITITSEAAKQIKCCLQTIAAEQSEEARRIHIWTTMPPSPRLKPYAELKAMCIAAQERSAYAYSLLQNLI